MSSRKRKPEEAGIKIHVKKEDLDGPDDEEIDDEEREETPAQQVFRPQVPLVKRVIKRRHQQQQQESSESTNLFAGIGSKFGQPNKPSFSANAFGGSSSSTTSGNPFGSSIGSSFGSSFGASAGTSTASSSANSSVPSVFSASAVPTPAAAPVASTSSTPLQAKEGSSGDDDQYRAMVALNTSFLSWLSNKVKMSPESSLVDGVRKYIEHCNSISSSNSAGTSNGVHSATSSTPSTTAATNSASSSSLPFTMPAAPSNASSSASLFGSSTAPSVPLFQVSTQKEAATTKSAAPLLFGSSTGTTSLFGQSTTSTTSLFGGPSSTTGSSSSLFGGQPTSSSSLFGNTAAPSSSLFANVGQPSSSLFASSTKPKNEDDDGENEGAEDDDEPEPSEPTKEAQRHVSTDETTLFEIEPCKVMVLKDKAWANRGGKGRLVISRHKETNKCRALLRATATGAIYFNASVNHSMLSTLSKQKNTVRLMTSSFVTNEKGEMQVDNDGKPTLYAFKVMTEDDAEKLRAALADAMK